MFEAPRFHVIAPVEESCSQYTPSSSSTMHREGINGIIHLKTALRFPLQQHQAQLTRRNGRGDGFYKFYKWKGGGGTFHTDFLFGTEKIFCEFVVRCFFCSKNIASVQGKENILNTRLIHQSEILQNTSHCVGIPSSTKNLVLIEWLWLVLVTF